MNLHLVKVKCTILGKNRDGEDVGKSKNTAIALRRAETFGNAEVETAKYFGQKASPENNYAITGIGILNVQDVLINFELDPEEVEGKWFKIKVALSLDGDIALTNVYLVFEETMDQAQKRVKNLLSNTAYDTLFKVCSEIALMEYIELPEELEDNENDSQFSNDEEEEEVEKEKDFEDF